MHIIAEIGSNWRDGTDRESKKRAIELIDSAAQNGARIVKFQLFLADRLYRDTNKISSLRDLELPVGWLKELKTHAENQGVEFLVTPFYPEAVDKLELAEVKFYKIASTDIAYIPLLTRVALTGKPVFLSTIGGKIIDDADMSFEEVDQALEILRPETERDEWGSVSYNDVVLLHCVSNYPAPTKELNLGRLIDLAAEFMPLETGFSSHSLNVPVTASVVAYGASYIEVHYDLDDSRGVESAHSYSPDMLQQLVQVTKDFEDARECNCRQTFSDFQARKDAFRDPVDWLRPPLENINELQ